MLNFERIRISKFYKAQRLKNIFEILKRKDFKVK